VTRLPPVPEVVALEAEAGGAVVARSRPAIRPWGQWLVTALFLGFLLYIATRFAGGSGARLDVAHAQWGWLPVAVGLHAICFALYGALYQRGFRVVGVQASARRLVAVLFASIFVKTVVPLTGATAMAVFIDDAVAHGQSGARAAAGTIVVTAIDLLAALPFVLAGVLALELRGQLAPYDVLGVAFFVAFIGVLVAALALAGLRPGLLAIGLRGVRAAVNRLAAVLGRPAPVPAGWVERSAGQFGEAAIAAPRHPRDVLIALAYSGTLHLANVLGLYALFLAFGVRPDPGVVMAGFGASIVFFVVAVVPDGIGAVEGAMTLVFVSLGIDPATAILVTLAYRVLNVWVPVALGYLSARQLRLFGGRGVAVGA
jgi:uncharacterized protein (TIRG00374 family)